MGTLHHHSTTRTLAKYGRIDLQRMAVTMVRLHDEDWASEERFAMMLYGLMTRLVNM